MPSFKRLIRFECEEDGEAYFSDIGLDFSGIPPPGTKLGAFSSINELTDKAQEKTVTVRRVWSPLHLVLPIALI